MISSSVKHTKGKLANNVLMLTTAEDNKSLKLNIKMEATLINHVLL